MIAGYICLSFCSVFPLVCFICSWKFSLLSIMTPKYFILPVYCKCMLLSIICGVLWSSSGKNDCLCFFRVCLDSPFGEIVCNSVHVCL